MKYTTENWLKPVISKKVSATQKSGEALSEKRRPWYQPPFSRVLMVEGNSSHFSVL
ncbi:MAG: hypothetical protein V4722_11090 [Bacteroidota bacterium]